MTTKVEPTVEKWEEISKKLRLCPECWTLSEGAGYCTCGGFKRLDFSNLPEKEQKMWIDGFERGESQSVQEAKAEGMLEHGIEALERYFYMVKMPESKINFWREWYKTCLSLDASLKQEEEV